MRGALGRRLVGVAAIGVVVAVAATLAVFALPRPPGAEDDPDQLPRGGRPGCLPADGPRAGALPPGGTIEFERDTPALSGIAIIHKATFTAEEMTVDEQARSWQSGTLEIAQELTLAARARLRLLEIEVEGHSGTSTTYGFVLPADQAGSMPLAHPPSPYDPEAVPVGGSVSMGRKAYRGGGLRVGYRGLVVTAGHESGTEVSTVVTRLTEHRVRVTVGPTEFVDRSLSFGLGAGDAALTVDLGRQLEESHLYFAEFELTRPAEQDAYYRLVFGGERPASSSDHGTVSGLEFAHDNGLSLSAEGAGFSIGGRGSGGSVTVTGHADGSAEATAMARNGDLSATRDDAFDPDGRFVADRSVYRLVLRGVGEEELRRFNEVYANRSDVRIDGRQNFVLAFTPDDFSVLREEALEIMAATIRLDDRGRQRFPELGAATSAEDVRGWLAGLDSRGLIEAGDRFADYRGIRGAAAFELYTRSTDGDILTQLYLAREGPLEWLIGWSEALWLARGLDDRIGVGEGICRSVVAVRPLPTREVSCPDLAFVPNSDDGAFEITTRLVPCLEVESFLRAWRRQERPPVGAFSFRLFDCRLIEEDHTAMSMWVHRCEQGPRWFEWTTVG